MADMNDNANLYNPTLCYDANSSPRACLTLPWWIQTPHPTYFPRHSCKIEPLICGERVFMHIARDIEQAKHTVDIITWGFDPGMVLVRGSDSSANAGDKGETGKRYGDLLKEVASRKNSPVIVRLLVWHDDAPSMSKMNNMPGYYGKRYPTVGSSSSGFSDVDHANYNASWFDDLRDGKMPNISFHVRSVPNSDLARSLSGEASPRWSAAGLIAEMYATHHQKMVLIDYEAPAKAIGYVMGHNSITDFWDTDKHVFRDPRRETFYTKDPAEIWNSMPKNTAIVTAGSGPFGIGSVSMPNPYDEENAVRAKLASVSYVTKPYQDVSSRLQGPILYDLNQNFCQAWEESVVPNSYFIENYWLVQRAAAQLTTGAGGLLRKITDKASNWFHSDVDGKFIARRKKLLANAFSLAGGEHSVQLMRTQPQHGEKAIKECYANLTRQMQHYIFIQNQYIQYESWADHLMQSVQRLRSTGYQAPIYVFLLTSTPEKDGMDLPTYDVARKIGESSSMTVEHAEAVKKAKQGKGDMPIGPKDMAKQGINVVMGSLWTCAENPAKATDYEEIYIHAKVAVVDDAAFTLGSANLNLRSMAIDSELNILSNAQDVAFHLRSDLFSQCTGESGPAQFADMKETFDDWGKFMTQNAKLKKNIEPLQSQLLPFYVNRPYGSPVV